MAVEQTGRDAIYEELRVLGDKLAKAGPDVLAERRNAYANCLNRLPEEDMAEIAEAV